tara:strand:- start:61129 stop:62766 length:1638 start_codon:yes stop_codon:yes gene_type:complete
LFQNHHQLEQFQLKEEEMDFYKDFFPTNEALYRKMMDKVVKPIKVDRILIPGAGRGDEVEWLKEKFGKSCDCSLIEINPELQNIIRGKKLKLIDSDFLSYNGQEHFDLIISNFPFSIGCEFLLKAIEITYSGQIVCLINAETIRNPYSNLRKVLKKKLEDLNADIEFLEDEFIDSERKTSVEVALIHIEIKNEVESDLFHGLKVDDEIFEVNEEIEDQSLTRKDEIHNLVKKYELTKQNVINQIIEFYKYKHLTHGYLALEVSGSTQSGRGSLTEQIKLDSNNFITTLKRDYWSKVTQLEGVKSRLSSKKRDQLHAEIESYLSLEFSESNIKQFIINIIQKFPKLISESIEELFDNLTSYSLIDNRWNDRDYASNIHYYNAWASNSGYKINKKVIYPLRCLNWDGSKVQVDYQHEKFLNDLDLVVNYFSDNCTSESCYEICRKAIEEGITKKIETANLRLSFFKKGTIHIEFKNTEVLRRFNIEAGKLKNFLPMDYANKAYADLKEEEIAVVEAFETSKTYKPEATQIPILENFANYEIPLIEVA